MLAFIRAVGLEPKSVVVEEHIEDDVELLRVGRERIFQFAIDTNDVFVHGFGEPIDPILFPVGVSKMKRLFCA